MSASYRRVQVHESGPAGSVSAYPGRLLARYATSLASSTHSAGPFGCAVCPERSFVFPLRGRAERLPRYCHDVFSAEGESPAIPPMSPTQFAGLARLARWSAFGEHPSAAAAAAVCTWRERVRDVLTPATGAGGYLERIAPVHGPYQQHARRAPRCTGALDDAQFRLRTPERPTADSALCSIRVIRVWHRFDFPTLL